MTPQCISFTSNYRQTVQTVQASRDQLYALKVGQVQEVFVDPANDLVDFCTHHGDPPIR